VKELQRFIVFKTGTYDHNNSDYNKHSYKTEFQFHITRMYADFGQKTTRNLYFSCDLSFYFYFLLISTWLVGYVERLFTSGHKVERQSIRWVL